MTAPVHAGIEGSLETSLQADNAYNKERVLFDIWGDVLLKDKGRKNIYGFSFSTGLRDEKEASSIYQLYAKRNVPSSSTTLKGGRFERSDQSGYYTVDGADLKKDGKAFSLSLYGGNLLRIEDARHISGGTIGGIELSFKNADKKNALHAFAHIQGELALQRIDKEASATKISMELSGESRGDSIARGYWKFNTSGSYLLEEEAIDTFLADLALRPGSKSFFRLSYELFDYKEEELTFKDSFYSLYASGKEEALNTEIYYSPSKRLELYLFAKKIQRDDADNGYGTRAGTSLKTKTGSVTAELDYLNLNDEDASTMLLSLNCSLNERTRADLNVIYQILNKRTTGMNRRYGIETSLERMIGGERFFSIYGTGIMSDEGEDDYKLGVKLRVLFNGDKI